MSDEITDEYIFGFFGTDSIGSENLANIREVMEPSMAQTDGGNQKTLDKLPNIRYFMMLG